ncbi:MAG: response regulator [Ignavibacteriaceae bacterium]|jgi:signal transduction histidine kinase/CheY-like chemotaxis protein/Tfp pilus assembly protein PilF|nr:response regulator [Ignavibacteriaceae bacterium]
MKKLILVLLFLSFTNIIPQTTALIDSLKGLLPYKHDKEKVDMLNLIAFNYFTVSTDSGFYYGKNALSLAQKLNYKKGMADAYLYTGQNFYYLNNLDSTLAHYMLALKLYEEINNSEGIADTYTAFGYMYSDNANLGKAMEYWQKALKLYDQNNLVTLGKVFALKGIGENYLKNKIFTKALEYLSKTLELEKVVGDGVLGLTYTYQKLGLTYVGLKNYSKAKESFTQGIQIAEKNRDVWSLGPILVDFGQMFLDTKDYDNALKYSVRAIELFKEINSPYLLPAAYKTLADCYRGKGDYKKAYESYIIYSDLKDSTSSLQRTKQIEEIQSSYAAEKKEHQITLLKKEGDVQLLWRNIFVGAFVFILFAVGAISYQYKQKSKANDKLVIANAEAAQANMLKTELLGIAAHDLRNPLTTIIGFSDLAKADISKDSQLAEYVEVIEDSSKNMLNLINKLLDSSAIETGKLKIECEPLKINDLAKKINKEFQSAALNKKQNLIFTETHPEIFVNADVERLQEVIENLVSNAIKYSQYGKSIHINLKQIGQEAIYEVIDEGPGFTEADKVKVFGKFQRLSARPTGGEASSGLGLSIAKQLIELQNGKISIESEFGKGATFRIILPAIEVLDKSKLKEIESKKGVTENLVFNHASILIADDIYGNRKILKEFLYDFGFEIYTVVNGKELMQAAERLNPDLILTDINMPEMDGYEVITEIKKSEKLHKTPVIAVTAEDKQKVITAGFNDQLKKPIDKLELVAILKNYLKYDLAPDDNLKSTSDKSLFFNLSPEEVESLINEITPDWTKVIATMEINDIEKLADIIIHNAKKLNSDGLLAYGNELKKNSEEFDVESITSNIEQFKFSLNNVSFLK